MGESRPVPSTLQHPVITKSWRGHQGIAIGLWWVMGVRGAKPSTSLPALLLRMGTP